MAKRLQELREKAAADELCKEVLQLQPMVVVLQAENATLHNRLQKSVAEKI